MGAAGANVERCGAWAPLDDGGHCRQCVQAAVTRAAVLDSFELGVGLCLEASIDEIQLRHALILAVNGTEAALSRFRGQAPRARRRLRLARPLELPGRRGANSRCTGKVAAQGGCSSVPVRGGRP
jgi:hypothetical protein